MKKRTLAQITAQRRFNYGFWDGQADRAQGRNRRTIPNGTLFCMPDDSEYVAGYAKGNDMPPNPAWENMTAGGLCIMLENLRLRLP